MKINEILCPTDFSTESEAAMRQALSVARAHDATVHLLHVAEVGIPTTSGFAYSSDSGSMHQAQQRLEDVEPAFVDVNCRRYVVQGKAGEEIVKYSDQNEIDLVVMATQGRSGLHRMLMGSVAEYVIRNVDCPVLAIRSSSEAS